MPVFYLLYICGMLGYVTLHLDEILLHVTPHVPQLSHDDVEPIGGQQLGRVGWVSPRDQDVRIGQVRSIGLADDLRALVTLEVGSEVELSVDSEASIRTAGLLGDQFIALEPGAEDENLGDGDEFAYTNSAFSIDRLIGTLVHGDSLGGDE